MTVVVGALERLARRVQVAHPEAYLADEIVRVPDPEHQAKSLELLTGLTGLLLGFRPLTSKHLQLGAMNSAHTRIPTHRLSAHPSLGLVGPLRSTLEVSDVPARRHRVAEDLACVEEAKLAGRSGRRRLVDQGQARSPIPGGDLGHALERHRRKQCVRAALPASNLHRPLGDLDGLGEVRGDQFAESAIGEQGGVDPRFRLRFKQVLGAGQPSHPDRHGAALEGLVSESECDLGGVGGPAHIAVARECPLECLGRIGGSAGPP